MRYADAKTIIAGIHCCDLPFEMWLSISKLDPNFISLHKMYPWGKLVNRWIEWFHESRTNERADPTIQIIPLHSDQRTRMKIDPKTKNLIKFLGTRLAPFIAAVWAAIKFSGERDVIKIIGYTTLVIIIWRSALSIYRRLILPAKDPRSYGKWAVVTGTTSGIGREFADHLAKLGMPLLIISRSASKLQEQAKELQEKYSVTVKYLAYDFGQLGDEKKQFYADLDKELQKMDTDGGIGLLVNNVGTANDIPMALEELGAEEIDSMLNCNIQSVVWMTRAVLPFMKRRKSGGIVSISSGSGNGPGPFLSVYSSTK